MKQINPKKSKQTERQTYVPVSVYVFEMTPAELLCQSKYVEEPDEYPGYEM